MMKIELKQTVDRSNNDITSCRIFDLDQIKVAPDGQIGWILVSDIDTQQGRNRLCFITLYVPQTFEVVEEIMEKTRKLYEEFFLGTFGMYYVRGLFDTKIAITTKEH